MFTSQKAQYLPTAWLLRADALTMYYTGIPLNAISSAKITTVLTWQPASGKAPF